MYSSIPREEVAVIQTQQTQTMTKLVLAITPVHLFFWAQGEEFKSRGLVVLLNRFATFMGVVLPTYRSGRRSNRECSSLCRGSKPVFMDF